MSKGTWARRPTSRREAVSLALPPKSSRINRDLGAETGQGATLERTTRAVEGGREGVPAEGGRRAVRNGAAETGTDQGGGSKAEASKEEVDTCGDGRPGGLRGQWEEVGDGWGEARA